MDLQLNIAGVGEFEGFVGVFENSVARIKNQVRFRFVAVANVDCNPKALALRVSCSGYLDVAGVLHVVGGGEQHRYQVEDAHVDEVEDAELLLSTNLLSDKKDEGQLLELSK